MKFTFVISLLLVTGVTLWLSSSQFSITTPSEQNHLEHTLQSYIEGGIHTHFSQTGSIIELLTIDRAVKYLDQSEAHIEGIHYQSQIDQEFIWDIQAATGKYLDAANELVLWDGVKVSGSHHDVHMQTDSMHVFMNQKKAVGQSPVLLTGIGSHTRGDRFELNMNSNKATLKGNVQTHYE